jgi:hypothetical protein
MKKIMLLALMATALLSTASGSAPPLCENEQKELLTQNEATPFACVEVNIIARNHCDYVVVIEDSNDFISVTTENVLATCKVLAAPALGIESVSNANAIHNNYTGLAETINSIFKDLPIDPGLCRC